MTLDDAKRIASRLGDVACAAGICYRLSKEFPEFTWIMRHDHKDRPAEEKILVTETAKEKTDG